MLLPQYGVTLIFRNTRYRPILPLLPSETVISDSCLTAYGEFPLTTAESLISRHRHCTNHYREE